MAQQRPGLPTKKTTKGPLHAVACPHCSTLLDFRPLAPSRAGGGAGEGDYGLETGTEISCDNPRCKRISVITSVQTITVVHLQQSWKRPR